MVTFDVGAASPSDVKAVNKSEERSTAEISIMCALRKTRKSGIDVWYEVERRRVCDWGCMMRFVLTLHIGTRGRIWAETISRNRRQASLCRVSERLEMNN